MELLKDYDCLPHDLLTAKLEAYGLQNGCLNLLLDYLAFRKQRTKVVSAYRKWSKITRGILEFLFNIRSNFVQYIY